MTKDERKEAAVNAYVDKLPMGFFMYAQTTGFADGYEAAIAAERERIVAEIEAKLISSSLPDAYEEGFDDGLKAAIEIVKEAIPND